MRSLVRTLVDKGSVVTSLARAKIARGFFDRLVRIARIKTLSSHRRLLSLLGGDEKTVKDFTDIAVKLGRADGSTRVIKLGTRRGDSSARARLEWTENKLKTQKSNIKSTD